MEEQGRVLVRQVGPQVLLVGPDPTWHAEWQQVLAPYKYFGTRKEVQYVVVKSYDTHVRAMEKDAAGRCHVIECAE